MQVDSWWDNILENVFFFPLKQSFFHVQENIVFTWLLSLSMETSKPQFKHEQFGEQLYAGNCIGQ